MRLMVSPPCPPPPGIFIIPSHWKFIRHEDRLVFSPSKGSHVTTEDNTNGRKVQTDDSGL